MRRGLASRQGSSCTTNAGKSKHSRLCTSNAFGPHGADRSRPALLCSSCLCSTHRVTVALSCVCVGHWSHLILHTQRTRKARSRCRPAWRLELNGGITGMPQTQLCTGCALLEQAGARLPGENLLADHRPVVAAPALQHGRQVIDHSKDTSATSDRHLGAVQYSFSLTTFSPSGKLVQIEYALNAVSQGATSLGIKASNGVVIATEKKLQVGAQRPASHLSSGEADLACTCSCS